MATEKRTKNMRKAVKTAVKYLKKVVAERFSYMSYGELRWIERLLEENSHATWEDREWVYDLDEWLTSRNPNDRALLYGYMEDSFARIVHIDYEVYTKGTFLYALINDMLVVADVDTLFHHGLVEEFLEPPFKPLFKVFIDEQEGFVRVERIYE